MKKNLHLSVILPAYKDSQTIGIVVKSLLKEIKPVVGSIEIIIVEDGSPDDTCLVCDVLANSFPEVKVIHHSKNLGYGKTLRDGFNFATKEVIFYTDGDNQYNIKELIPALNIFIDSNVDALIGFRDQRIEGLCRILVSRIYNYLFALLFGIKVRDVNCSFKLFKKEALRSLSLCSDSAFIDAEMVYMFQKKGFKLKEYAVTNYPNNFRKSNFVNPRLSLEMLYEVFKKRFSF